MNIKQIAKLREKLDGLRQKGGIKPTKIESLARACGRNPSKRGKEPTWINKEFQQLRPLSIPHHGEVNRFTAQSILDQLEVDLDTWENFLKTSEAKEGEDE